MGASRITLAMAATLGAVALLLGLMGPRPTPDGVNLFFMRFFRNLGRAKARARRMDSPNALAVASASIEVMFGLDDPATAVDYDAEAEAAGMDSAYSFSEEELAEFGDGQAGRPLLLAIFGRIYDVSAGEAFYGYDKKYHAFAAKDATRAFCTGCLRPECLIASTKGLTEAEVKEGRRWLEFFQLHDKYAFAGKLEAEKPVDMDDLVARALEAERGGAPRLAPEDLQRAREEQQKAS